MPVIEGLDGYLVVPAHYETVAEAVARIKRECEERRKQRIREEYARNRRQRWRRLFQSAQARQRRMRRFKYV